MHLSHSDRRIIRKEPAAITTWKVSSRRNTSSMERSRLWAVSCVRDRIKPVTVQAPGPRHRGGCRTRIVGECRRMPRPGHRAFFHSPPIVHLSFSEFIAAPAVSVSVVDAAIRNPGWAAAPVHDTGECVGAPHSDGRHRFQVWDKSTGPLRRVLSHSMQRAIAPPRPVRFLVHVDSAYGCPFRTYKGFLR